MSTPYDLIRSRENADFPFDALQSYARSIAVDWREADETIVEHFLAATGLPADDARVRWDLSKPYALLDHAGVTHDVKRDGRSAQDVMLRKLDELYGAKHQLRLLSHVANGDTAYLVVETPERWRELEAANPFVRWFFTPIGVLPDLFEGTFEDLAAAAKRYADGS
jgi:hypothetical protein